MTDYDVLVRSDLPLVTYVGFAMNVNERLVVAKEFKRLESEGKHCFVEGVKEHWWLDSAPESETDKLLV